MPSLPPGRPVAPGGSDAFGWLLPLAVVVAGLCVIPIGYLVLRVIEAGPARVFEILVRDRTLALVGRSLALTLVVTLASAVVGITLAYLVTRTDLPARRALATVAALPLAIPSYVAAFAWVSTWSAVEGFGAAAVVLTLCCYPFVYLPVRAAMRRVDPSTEEVARSLGRSWLHVASTVTLRQVRPAAASGMLLVSLYTLSDFGAVSILRYDVFTRVIHTSYRASFDRTSAAVLSVALVLITLVITLVESRARGRTDSARVDAGVARSAQPQELGAWRTPVGAVAWAVPVVALGFPVVSLVFWAVAGRSRGIDLGRLLESSATTVWFAVLGGVACTALALPIAILAARRRSPAVRVLEHATYAGHALPGIVVALAIVFIGSRFLPELYQRTPMLLLAYVVLFVPTAVGSIRAAVAMSSPKLEEAARALGSSSADVLRRVTLPLAAPGIAAGASLVVLTCMKELPATLLLAPTGSRTLATSLWSQTGVGAYAAAAPYGLVLVLIAVIPTITLMRSHRGAADGS